MDLTLKGEFVIIVEGAKKEAIALDLNEKSILEHFEYYKSLGNSDMAAMKLVAKDRGVSKSDIYSEIKK